MNKLQQLYYSNNKIILWKFALLVFIFILILHGTYFRVHPMEDVPEMDWVVIARLIVCSLGFGVGLILLLKNHARLGFGSIILVFFLTATGISAIHSLYPKMVIGYAVLLCGASVLLLGLVHSAQDVKRLEQIERAWFYTMALCVIKDAIISLIFPDPAAGSGILRLGMGITHANHISLLAGIIFWLSFKQTEASMAVLLLRMVMIFVIISAISRISILAFTCGGGVYFFLRAGSLFRRLTLIFVGLSAIVLLLLTFSLQERLERPIVDYLKRGQTQTELGSFTGRTVIWKKVLEQIPDSPFIGHGYGLSRFTLKPVSWDTQPGHCHNEFLEALFSLGIFGFVPLILMYIYNTKWIRFFSRLCSGFSSDLALHASVVVAMLWVSTFFESRISVRLLAFQPLFFFYLLTLDREKHFPFLKKKQEL